MWRGFAQQRGNEPQKAQKGNTKSTEKVCAFVSPFCAFCVPSPISRISEKESPMRRFVLRMISVLICLVVAVSPVYIQTKAPDVIVVYPKNYTLDSTLSADEGVSITDGEF